MKVHTLHQSQQDSDLYILRVDKTPLTILYGQISLTSSLLRYLPKDYSDFGSNSSEQFKGNDVPMKRAKVKEDDSGQLTDAME